MFFKGYVATKDKKCVEKFKGRSDLKSYADVQSLPEFAGILAADTVLIDIDEVEASDRLFNIVQALGVCCRVYKTTRGKHFLFKNSGLETNRTHATLAVGVPADIKLGSRNSYSVLKFGGKELEIIYDTAANEEAAELPKWLMPVKSSMDFLNMEVGDGRNQALFNYILTLQASDFSVDETRECIRLMNQFVLKVPLSDDELEIILRDDAFNKPVFFKGNTFLFDKFATFMKNNSHIVKINNQLHLYRDGIYITGQTALESDMIRHIPHLNRAKRSEVMAYMDIMIRDNTPAADANLIAFRNGLYNVLDDSFIPFTPDHVITNRIDWDYNPNAYSELADETLNKIACQDAEIRLLLEEVVGYCFYRRNELGKAFILTGDKSNGKSTFLDMVKTLLGENNIAALDLKEVGDRFKTAELFGKLANIGDDIGDEFIPSTGIFKKLVTGDRLNAERKGQNPFDFNNYSKLLFSANSIPRLGKGKDSAAIVRRLVVIPFDAKFSKDDPDFKPYIKYELRKQPAMEYLIALGLQGLKRVLENQSFTESERAQKQLEEFEESNNPVLGFLKETEKDEIENEPTNTVYRKYQEYCIINSLQPLSNGEFSKQVKRFYGFEIADKKLNGKKCRIFVTI